MRITFPLIINWFGGITSNIYSYYYPRIGYVTSQSNPNEFCHSDNTYVVISSSEWGIFCYAHTVDSKTPRPQA